MPELQTIRENGSSLSIPNMPTFDPAHILTSIALPAIIEPTFFGELILTGAAVYVGTVYVYEFAKWVKLKVELDNEAMCQMYLPDCVGRGWECQACYARCLDSGKWPREICPANAEEH
jgi:hypothetical protein